MSDQPKPVDLNSASVDELAKIPGIGPAIASRIEARRPYQSIEELKTVPGIGGTLLEQIRTYLYLSGADNGQTPGQESDQAQVEMDESPPETRTYEAEVVALPAPDEVEMFESGEPLEFDEASQVQPEEGIEPTGQVVEPDILPAGEEPGVQEAPTSETEEPEILLAEEESSAEVEQPETVEARHEPEPTVVIPEPGPAAKEQPRYASRSDAFWISFGSSFLGFVLAIGLTLGALALINNGLRYVSPAQLNAVSRQVDGLNSQASILQQDIDGLRTRVDNLEGLSGRVSTVEQTTKQLSNDLDAAATQVEQLNQNVSGLQTDVTELKSVSSRFQNFLDGLRELLNNEQQ